MGRSRGGLTTKIHALVDALGRPIRLKLTEGQAHDGRAAADMYGTVGPGQTLLADRAYDSDGLRDALAERGAVANIRLMPTRKRLSPSTITTINSATTSSGSSANLNTSEQLQPDAPHATTIYSRRSNSHLSGYG